MAFKMVLVSVVTVLTLFMSYGVKAQTNNNNMGMYDSRYDYLNVDDILDNKRLVRQYIDCLLSQKPCSPEGKALKHILPEGLRTKCARCTPKQKYLAVKVIGRLRKEYPDEWKRLTTKWDPTGDFTRRFESILSSNDDNNRVDTPVENMPTTTVRVTLFNRFGSDQESSAEPSDAVPNISPGPSVSTVNRITTPPTTRIPPTTRPPPTLRPNTMSPSTMRATMSPSTLRPITIALPTIRPITTTQPPTWRPITMSPSNVYVSTMRPPMTARPTRPRKKVPCTTSRPPVDPFVMGTMGIIDHFGNKIIRTTELVTGILKDTVRIVVGPRQ